MYGVICTATLGVIRSVLVSIQVYTHYYINFVESKLDIDYMHAAVRKIIVLDFVFIVCSSLYVWSNVLYNVALCWCLYTDTSILNATFCRKQVGH